MANVDANFGPSPAPFTLKVDDDFISAQRDLVESTRAPIAVQDLEPPDSDGPTLANFTRIRNYWVNEYDWGSVQASINRKYV